MKGTLMGVIMAGVILSSGCAAVTGAALASRGARSGVGEAMTFQRGPVYGARLQAADYHSLADRFRGRTSPAGPLGMATPPPMPDPGDTPLVESGVLGLYVKGFPAADVRRLGLSGYASSWAESGLGGSVAEISHDPSLIYTYVQLRVLPGGANRIVLY